MRAAKFYATWYPMKWLPFASGDAKELLHPDLQADLDAVARLSRKLSRDLFLAMALNGPKLEKRQVLLGHFVDVGAELFVWSCALAHAEAKFTDSSLPEAEIGKLVRLVKFFGKVTRERVAAGFSKLRSGLDLESWKVAQEV
jgi:hypothetical protein